jgi:hypothetical protein
MSFKIVLKQPDGTDLIIPIEDATPAQLERWANQANTKERKALIRSFTNQRNPSHQYFNVKKKKG